MPHPPALERVWSHQQLKGLNHPTCNPLLLERQLLSGTMTRTKLYVKRTWQLADAVCFDVDSTLITEEGIDGLAEFCGAGVQVREW